jgi:hypothetical protein
MTEEMRLKQDVIRISRSTPVPKYPSRKKKVVSTVRGQGRGWLARLTDGINEDR